MTVQTPQLAWFYLSFADTDRPLDHVRRDLRAVPSWEPKRSEEAA